MLILEFICENMLYGMKGIYFVLLLLIHLSLESEETNFDEYIESREKTLTWTVHPKKKVVKTLAEIEEAKVVIINQKPCQTNQTLIYTFSTPNIKGSYYERRQFIRNSWGKQAIYYGMRNIFVFGMPLNSDTQKGVIEESEKYNDIIQFGFIDGYNNLTLKSIAMLKWISQNCMSTDYVAKCDDDVLFNIKRFKSMINDKSFENGMTGWWWNYHGLYFQSIPNPENNPDNTWNKRFGAQYLVGRTYILSTNIIPKMVEAIDNFDNYVLIAEDAFITGPIAWRIMHNINATIHKSRLIRNDCSGDPCRLHRMLVLTRHGCKGIYVMRNHWAKYLNTTEEECLERKKKI